MKQSYFGEPAVTAMSQDPDLPLWERGCWGVYSIVFDIMRVLVFPFVAIGYAVRDAFKSAKEEFKQYE